MVQDLEAVRDFPLLSPIDRPEKLEYRQRKESGSTQLEGIAVETKKILGLLRAHKHRMTSRFDIVDLALFGSFARGQATETSDIDILARFAGPATSKQYFGVQFYIEDLLGLEVDLVTDKALREELRPFIEREALYV